MSNETSVNLNLSTGLFALCVTGMLILLKINGYIDWSWIWVLFPVWIGVACSLAILCMIILAALAGLVLLVVCGAIGAILEMKNDRRRYRGA